MPKARQIYASVAKEMALATALPPAAYLDSDVFADEMDLVFRKGWMPVARTSEVAHPGDYRTADLCGEALVITRDKKDKINVLSGICRHRAMPVAEGSGKTKALVCPYHIWRYDLDGSFLSAPGMQKSDVFDPSKCSLPSFRHEEWGGWVFVNLSGDAAPLGPQLAPLAERLEPLNPEGLVSVGYLEFDSPWNWKVMVENFLESYHHIGVHANTLQQSNPGLGTYCADMDGPFTVLENPPGDDDADAFMVACVFPLAMMFFTEGALRTGGWYELCDIKADRFVLRIHILVPEEIAGDEDAIRQVTETVRMIHHEDIPFCEGVQKGLHSRAYRSGPLSHLEGCNFKLHQFLADSFEDGA